MADDTNTIKAQFGRDDSDRDEVLERARQCAALSKPWILPPETQKKSEKLPQNYQSTGSRGTLNLEGKMLLALYPPIMPWFQLLPNSAIRHDPNNPPEAIQEIEQQLFLFTVIAQAKIEAANLTDENRRRRSGFRSRKRMALSQILVTGDVLEQLTDDYRLKLFRRDQYVTSRDSSGDTLYHITRENVDPLALDEKIIEKAGLSLRDLQDKTTADRMTDLFTRIEWQPITRKWLIEQEINDKTVVQSDEPISPYMSTAFELAPGEDYGRGFIELNLGDLSSHNELRLRELDFAAMASKQLMAVDYGSQVTEDDLTKPSGSVIQARVSAGSVQDIASLKMDKQQDFSVVFQVDEQIRRDLDKAMLVESEVQPTGDRVTRFQVQRVAQEVEGALGGLYSPIADDQQVPLARRLMYQVQRDRIIPTFKPDLVDIDVLTGITALSRQIAADQVLDFTAMLAQLGDQAIRKIDLRVLADVMARWRGIQEPGLIKSNEQLAAEDEAAMKMQLQMQAAQQAIQTTGKVVEQQAAQPPQQQPTQGAA